MGGLWSLSQSHPLGSVYTQSLPDPRAAAVAEEREGRERKRREGEWLAPKPWASEMTTSQRELNQEAFSKAMRRGNACEQLHCGPQ